MTRSTHLSLVPPAPLSDGLTLEEKHQVLDEIECQMDFVEAALERLERRVNHPLRLV